jgi:23S rRNA (cytosine1962-C5)-methyltransferase
MVLKMQLGRKRGYRVEAGHPWVYDNEIETITGEVSPGEVAEVYNCKNRFVGRGVCNPKSHILVRLFTRDPGEALDAALVRRRIVEAWAYRKKIGYTENARVVFSEADFLPGLVVDKFGDVLVVQILSLAIETFRDEIVSALRDEIRPRGIYERSDAAVRELEGLPLKKGVLMGDVPSEIVVTEPGGVKFLVDVENGQKTGFFLDQKENRLVIEPFVKDADVLDAFCYTGSFSLYAAKFGAKSVLGLDQSEAAVALARRNVESNDAARVCAFEAVNAFDALNAYVKEGRRFDTVLLDPPAFTKTKAKLDGALRGYKEVNLRALQILKPGGFLVTSSCSHFLTPELFAGVVFEAASDARRTVRQVLFQTQAKDHPVLWGVDESLYLKFLVLQAM